MTFETFLNHEKQTPRGRRRITYAISLAAHAAVLGIGVAYSFGQVEELSPPAVPLIFLSAPPPPPPPPPAPGGPRRTTDRVKHRPTEIVQPDRNIPPKEAPRTEGKEPGVVGGDKNGVKGGVIGGTGIVPAPPAPTTFLPPNVARGQLAIDPQSDRYRVKLPPALARAGMSLWAMVRVCVKPDGQVEAVTLIKKADPILDPIIVGTLQTWRYRAYTVNGRPVPFCTNVRYEITTR